MKELVISFLLLIRIKEIFVVSQLLLSNCSFIREKIYVQEEIDALSEIISALLLLGKLS